MFSQRALTATLERTNTSHIKSTILINEEGSILAYAGESENEAKLVAAIASNSWESSSRNGGSFLNQDLEFMIVGCDYGQLFMTKVNPSVLLCLCADDMAPIGIVKRKVAGRRGS
ncbi:hypothetical protein ACOME3_004011 [Neoechinorhynchus agilis]